MSNTKTQLDPMTSPGKARSAKAMAYWNGNEPTEAELQQLDTNLYTSNNYVALSAAGPNVKLAEGHAALLVGKILDVAGVRSEAQAEVEALVRKVVSEAANGA